MHKHRTVSKQTLALGCAVLAAATTGFWLAQSNAEGGVKSTDEGFVVTGSPPAAAVPPGAPAAISARTASLPALPGKVIATVERAYPLLTDVDFSCNAGGCAITATIPPPTGEAFLAQRQEMLLGGLAKAIDASGYRAVGPVQMDEVDDNLFQIRLPIAQAPSQHL